MEKPERTLSEALEKELAELELDIPDLGKVFREEYQRRQVNRNNRWRSLPEWHVSGLFAELLATMRNVRAQIGELHDWRKDEITA